MSPYRLQSYRWCAAAATARAASGEAGASTPKALRQQAVTWLREDLDVLHRLHEAREIDSPELRRRLAFWKRCPDLEVVRDSAALLRLSAAEQKACVALWEDVDRLLAAAGRGVPK